MTALMLIMGPASATAAQARSEIATQELPSPGHGDALDLETWAAGTLEANPGSQRIDTNTILLEPGIRTAFPQDGEMSTQAATQCARGWLCAWPHANFEGPPLGIMDGVYIDYSEWWWNEGTGQVVWSRLSPGNGWDDYALDISSLYNNTHTVLWARFFEAVRVYNAYNGGPASWIGWDWNDRFYSACAC